MQQTIERTPEKIYCSSQSLPYTSSATTSNTNKSYRSASLTFRVLRWLLKILFKLLFKLEVCGQEHLQGLEAGGYILAANHLSYLDAFLVLTTAPAVPRIYFMGAREQMEGSAFRRFMAGRIGGVIPVVRGKGTAYREVADRVEQVLTGGGVLGIFPEGTVSSVETGQLLPFKKGVGYFAARSGCTIVPVAFSGTREFWLRKRIVMVIGEPIPGQIGGRTTAEQLTIQTAASIQAILPTPVATPNIAGPKFLKNRLTNLFG